MDYQIELTESLTGYDGFFRLNRYRLRHSLYRGGMGPEVVRERVERLRAVAVVPYDPVRDQVVLVEQFRIGALELGRGAWLTEIPGGIWPEGESPEAVAHHEVAEETGCRLLDLLPIGQVWVSPGTASERVMLYCGRVDASRAGGVHGLDHEGEDIRVVVMDLKDAVDGLFRGAIDTSAALMALQWLALNRQAVRRAWTPAGGTREGR